ncbi:Proteasomal ubiquitin receptor ADRM1 [Colletotrichum chlorophyti]|uniref:Proteasomal ubiquitin receptor ADRM1 n=1 Tax=Colletotrichum chlorophyti TaxID=708187 RepID=A0A1Q8RW34_9PEZI|nr:Proteasomal ubiquitin receptor ADRM1 [Colletotrichum chlorophyti]
MSIVPIITFKAGICEADTSSKPYKVKPQATPGYIYLYSEDDLIHFCWRERSASLEDPELDLVMVPMDGEFVPHTPADQPTAKTNGRIFVLKFGSSSQRHFFWLQSKPQSRNGDPSWFSPRDKKIGEIVNALLQGEEVNVTRELSQVRNTDDRRDDDDDETMEDVEGQGDRNEHSHGGSGGAGSGATGGDIREEGENAREGGSDGARAAAGGNATDADAAVRNFLESLRGNPGLSGSHQGGQQQHADKPYPYLNHLLPNEITVPMLRTASEEYIDSLLSYLPPAILVLATESDDLGDSEPTADAAAAAKATLSLAEKKSLIERILRSPQFHQALGSLTMALRDGGLPTIAEALNVRVPNGGYMRGGAMPLGGGEAVEAFVEGVKSTVKEKKQG